MELLNAINACNATLVEELLRNGYQHELKASGITFYSIRATYLQIAINKGSPDVVKVLIDYGANINRVDALQGTPLHYAVCTNLTTHKSVRNSVYAIIKLLLSKKYINIDAGDVDGITPLMISTYGDATVCSLLLNAGADIYIESKRGWNASMYAINVGRDDCNVKLILMEQLYE